MMKSAGGSHSYRHRLSVQQTSMISLSFCSVKSHGCAFIFDRSVEQVQRTNNKWSPNVTYTKEKEGGHYGRQGIHLFIVQLCMSIERHISASWKRETKTNNPGRIENEWPDDARWPSTDNLFEKKGREEEGEESPSSFSFGHNGHHASPIEWLDQLSPSRL